MFLSYEEYPTALSSAYASCRMLGFLLLLGPTWTLLGHRGASWKPREALGDFGRRWEAAGGRRGRASAHHVWKVRPPAVVRVVPVPEGDAAVVEGLDESAEERAHGPALRVLEPRRDRRRSQQPSLGRRADRREAGRARRADRLLVDMEHPASTEDVHEVQVAIVQRAPVRDRPVGRHEAEARHLLAHPVEQ